MIRETGPNGVNRKLHSWSCPVKHTYFNADAPLVPTLKSTYLPALKMTLVNDTSSNAINMLLSDGKHRAYFMNAHCCNVAARDRHYAAAIAVADVLLPDGFGIDLAAKMSGYKLTENLNGTDLIPALLKDAALRGKSVYLFGGKVGIAEAAAEALKAKIPSLRIAGTRDGYEGGANDDAVVDAINASGADIVLVALGVPRQELWLDRNAVKLNVGLTMGVGAALDFFAGNVVRAPSWVRRARSEWVWRLAQEPRRLAGRYLLGNGVFLGRAATTCIRQLTLGSVASRALDVVVAGSALVALLPVLATTAVAIKLDSRGPVIFKQTRVGKDGAPFDFYKFRSMTQDAEARRAAVLSNSDREGICFKSRTDPRITRVGKFIRRFSIDELPQIYNVLRGEMAIVGPRPALPSEVAQYPIRALGRLAIKPGITGVWQVSGRADIGFDRMIDMDLAYASSRTMFLDLILILMTFRAVVSGRGAH
jgi:exopolysaccharide biosynthesis WecB/TagA/CpsF family protein